MPPTPLEWFAFGGHLFEPSPLNPGSAAADNDVYARHYIICKSEAGSGRGFECSKCIKTKKNTPYNLLQTINL